jgi:hypothetical protein
MGWTAPTIRSTGELISASEYNVDLADNIQFLHDRMHGGFINADGSIASGSGDFTCTKNGTGDYTITYTTAYASWATAVANPSGTAEIADMDTIGLGLFRVKFWNLSDALTDTAFSFITMGA